MPKTAIHKSRGESTNRSAKRVYTSPRLVEYGSVKKLTAGVGGSNFDPGHGVLTKTGGM